MGKRSKQGFVSLGRWGLRFLWRTSRVDTSGYLIFIIVQVATEMAQLWVAAQIIGELGGLAVGGTGSHIVSLALISILLMTVEKLAWHLLSFFERRLYSARVGQYLPSI
jgi:hypothetical protein